MAVVLGTSAGFVTAAPTSDPVGTNISTIDDFCLAQKDVAPVGATKITEIGWYTGENTNEVNYELGLYAHDVDTNKPTTRLQVDTNNAKGTTKGWKKVTVDWDITAGTTYWLALQVDYVNDTVYIDRSSSSGAAYNWSSSAGQTALITPWPASFTTTNYIIAIYAVWESGAEYVDITGTITGTSSLSGTLTYLTQVSLTGTITGVSTVGGLLGATLIVSSNWQTINFHTPQRLVVAGSDSIWFEDI